MARSAWASRQRLVLGQEAVDKRSNEIVAILLLLERLELSGVLVTIAATGCNTRSPRESAPREPTTSSLCTKFHRPTTHSLVGDHEPAFEEHFLDKR